MYLNNPAIDLILKAREARAKQRMQFAQTDTPSLSLTLNIPGFPKSNDLTKATFKLVLDDLSIFLMANRISINKEQAYLEIDHAGQIFISPLAKHIDLQLLKSLTERFEHIHPLGRIIDVDVFNEKGSPVSSGKQKPCIICKNKPAVVCMREHNHTYETLRATIFEMMESFLSEERKRNIVSKLGEFASRALLYEVSLTPKPGLVDYESSGAHTDMNYLTFLNAGAALSPFWSEFASAGLNFDKDLSEALAEIRIIGLKAETAMFNATAKVNTHKGLIFLLGISIFATAYVFQKDGNVPDSSIVNTIKAICQNIVEEELDSKSINKTHGETVFEQYGLKGAGARWEAQNGLPIVFKHILPFLKTNLQSDSYSNSKELNSTLTKALLMSIAKLNDSNILFRKGENALNHLQQYAQEVTDGHLQYDAFCKYCVQEHISPGGSADLLAVALFFTFINNELE